MRTMHWMQTPKTFLSTPSARRATYNGSMFTKSFEISIHALREEGDARRPTNRHSGTKFLSTPSARRATRDAVEGIKGRKFLSTPSARRATLQICLFVKSFFISIHALREEGDETGFSGTEILRNFYPRPPRGGRRYRINKELLGTTISIHALREEGDAGRGIAAARPGDFYPRPPRGGRRVFLLISRRVEKFLSTPSARRATAVFLRLSTEMIISIHALREEGDGRCFPADYGEAISIHALREEGDAITSRSFSSLGYFYPRPPRGGRPGSAWPFPYR